MNTEAEQAVIFLADVVRAILTGLGFGAVIMVVLFVVILCVLGQKRK